MELVKLVFAGIRLSVGGKATVGLPRSDVDDGVRKVDPKGSDDDDDDDVWIAPADPATGNVAANGCGGLLLSKTSNGDEFEFTAGGGCWGGYKSSRSEAADRDWAIGLSVVGVNTSNGDDLDCADTTDDDTDDLSDTVVTLVWNKSRGFGFVDCTGIGTENGIVAGVDCVANESNGDDVFPGVERPRGIGTRSGGCNNGVPPPLLGLFVGAKPTPVTAAPPLPMPVLVEDTVT